MMLQGFKMAEPELIAGGQYIDKRGIIKFVNDFSLEEIKRFYIIKPSTQQPVRAWQGHEKESKFFYCLRGSFAVALVLIDNWDKPSDKLEPNMFYLKAEKSKILTIPLGYANGFKALTEQSELLVFSDKTVEESIQDDYRYDSEKWINWDKL